MTDAVRARGLVKHYGEVKALDGIDLTVPQGSVLDLLGPNGAGKTTAVRILATLLTPDRGTAEVAGVDVLKDPREVRRRIGLSGQYAAVDEYLTPRPGSWAQQHPVAYTLLWCLVILAIFIPLTTRQFQRSVSR